MVGNAYDPTRTPAGSSCGSAVAVACCFCAAALGADTYSSLRRPSSFAGIYTLRSSFGMVSQTGLTRLNFDQDVIGPMCRNAEDMALIFDIIAGTDARDPYTADADSYIPQGGYMSVLDANGLQGKRIGYLLNSFGYLYQAGSGKPLDKPKELDAKVVGMVARAKRTLVDAGAELVDLSEALPESYIASVTGNDSPYNMLKIREHVTEVLKENNIDAVIYVSQTDVAETQKDPTGKFDNLSNYLYTFSPLGGLPEIILPMGLSKADPENGFEHELPLGLSAFAGYGNDDVLLQIAYAYDQVADVKTHPWTTPALPDPDLAAFAKELLGQTKALDRAEYSQESLAALDTATQALSGMKMGSGETEVDALTYQSAMRELAAAFDALEPLESATKDTAATTPTKGEPAEATEPTAATEKPAETKELLPTSTRFPWEIPVIVAVGMWALLFFLKRKFDKDDDI